MSLNVMVRVSVICLPDLIKDISDCVNLLISEFILSLTRRQILRGQNYDVLENSFNCIIHSFFNHSKCLTTYQENYQNLIFCKLVTAQVYGQTFLVLY